MNEKFDSSPFFIVGADRSGTTFLRLMLNEHPRLRIPQESHFLIDLMNEFPFDCILQPEDIEKVFELITEHPRWEYWDVENFALRELLFSLKLPTLPETIDAIYRNLNSKGKHRWGDKTPIYIREIKRIHQLFPDSKFIHIIRDGRDVCASLQNVRWWGKYTAKWAYYWQKSVNLGRNAGEKLGTAYYIEVKYEDLVLDTEKILKKICRFIGEEYDERMLSFYKKSFKEIPKVEQKIHTKTLRSPRATDVCRWPKELSLIQIAVIEIVAGKMLDYSGYPRKFPGLYIVTKLLDLLRSILAPIFLPLRNYIIRKFPTLRHYI